MDRVYIVECNGLHKIGYTSQSNVENRINQMRTGNPFTIKVIRDYKCENNDGFKKEQRLHKLYHDKRKEGEWFKLNQTDLLQIDKLMGVDIIERELLLKKKKLESELKNLKIKIDKLENKYSDLQLTYNEYKKHGLKDTESNHIRLEKKKIYLKRGNFNGEIVYNGETRFASKDYFVNIYMNDFGGTLYFKRKKRI